MKNIDLVVKDLVGWIQEKVGQANAKGIIFGLSGGIDSAVMAAIGKLAFPDDCLGVIMPCHSNPVDEEHGILVAEGLGLKTQKVDLSASFDLLLKSIQVENKNNMAISNIKPRLRMTTLYYIGQTNNYLVVGPTNRSEYEVGYFTKHGDSAVDLLPLASFVKSEIRQLAEYLEIPKIVIEKPPTAGLWEDQTDEDEMGFGYDVLDNYIKTKEGPEEIKAKINRMNKISNHKRSYPPIFVPNSK